MAEFVLEDPFWGAALLIAAVLLAVLGVVAAMAVHRPVYFRMAMRNALRRRSQTTIVILGLMVGTAILSAAFVASDSMEYWIVEDVYSDQYMVDEWVRAENGGTFDYSVYEALASDADVAAKTDGLSPVMFIPGVSINNLDEGQTETDINVQGVDLALDGSLGTFRARDGTELKEGSIGPNETIVPQALAASARIDVGDSIIVYYMPPGPANLTGGTGGEDPDGIHIIVLTARHIVEDGGKVGHNDGRTLYVTLETARLMADAPGAISAVKVSNNGGVVSGMQHSDRAVEVLEGALDGVAPAVGMTGEGFSVDPVKRNGVEMAEDAATEIGNLLLVASSFTVVAGTLLIINIFTMLAEERKKELGISRAIGMRRATLVRSFTFEGVVYSLVAATLGTLIGIVIGWALINGFLGAIEGTGTIPFYFKDSSVLIAFCVGSLLTISTVVYSSWKISHLNIVRSIRSMEEPRTRKGGMKHVYQGAAVASLGILVSAMGFSDGGSLTLQAMGPSVVVIGMALVLRRWASSERANTIMGVGMVLYSVWALFYLEEGESTEGMIATIVIGLVLVGGSVLALVSNSRAIVNGIGLLLSRSPRGKAVGTPAIAYPLNKGFRTAMTIAMFGLIIFIVVIFSIFGSIFNPDADGEKGGYDLLAYTSMSVEDIHNINFTGEPGQAPQVSYETLQDSIEHADGMTERYIFGTIVLDDRELDTYGYVYTALRGIDGGFASHVEYSFTDRSDAYATDRDAWMAVAGDPDVCIVDKNTLSMYPSIEVGSNLSVLDASGTGGSRDYTIIGIADEFAFNGVFVQKEGLRSDFPQLRGDNLFLLTVRDGEDQHVVAKDLEADMSAVGLNVMVFDDLIEDYNRAVDQIFTMFTMFMGLGLVVGVASLGVLAVRSVIERKQEIGIMRAIGYSRGMVLGVFSTEMLFVTVVGILVGIGTGIITGYGIWKTNMSDFALDFVLPWDNVLMVVGITILAAVVCTFLPAMKASRTNPAEAVRWIE